GLVQVVGRVGGFRPIALLAFESLVELLEIDETGSDSLRDREELAGAADEKVARASFGGPQDRLRRQLGWVDRGDGLRHDPQLGPRLVEEGSIDRARLDERDPHLRALLP